MIIYVRRILNHLAPCYASDLENVQKLEVDTDYKVKITRPRNIRHHRKYWALLTLVFDNLPEELEAHFKSVEDLHYEIKLQTGHRDKWVTMGGQEVWRVRSISFEKMDQTEFEAFYDAAVDVIVRYILPGIEKEELINQITEF